MAILVEAPAQEPDTARARAKAPRSSLDGPVELPTELDETDGEYVLLAEIPGLVREDFTVTVRGDSILYLAGVRKPSAPHEGRRTHFSERAYGPFSRSIALPGAVRPDAVRACYVNGMLEVRLPKARVAPPESKTTR